MRRAHQVALAARQQVEGDERGGRFLRQLGDARLRRVQPELQRIEIQPVAGGDDDLAVDHAVLRQALEQRVVQFREVAVERPRVAALDIHIARAAEHDGPKAVPLRLVQVRARRGQSSASLASIGSMGGARAMAGGNLAIFGAAHVSEH